MSALKGALCYCGVYHTVNPKNKQIGVILKKWQEFKPTVVFCEGGIWPLEKSMECAVSLHGERRVSET